MALDKDECPIVSVVVPVWNSPKLIRLCLEALARQSCPRDRFEVLVVDNGSTDETADVVRSFPAVRLLSEPVPGSYKARNRGLSEARGAYVAFTDADCIPAPDWLSAAIAQASTNPDAGIIAGRIELFRSSADSNEVCDWYERLFAFNQAAYAAKGICLTANWLSPRQLLQSMGGFSSELKSGGDVDLSSRIAASGRCLVYADSMVVGHPIRGSLQELMQKRRRVTGGRWVSKKKKSLIRSLGGVSVDMMKNIGTIAAADASLVLKLKLAGLQVALSSVALAEVGRMALGAESERA